jgi:site-specific DNA recombinase
MLPHAQLEGVEIVAEFADEGISGGGMDRRDEFKRMLRFCQEQHAAGTPIDVIVCYDTSRFSRADSNETSHAIWEFRQVRVNRLLTAERWYDFRKEDDRAIFNLTQDFTNNRYLRNHAQQVTRGKKDNAEAAYANGGLPYGFDRLYLDPKTGVAQAVAPRLQKINKVKEWRVIPIPIPRDDPDPDRQLQRQTVENIFRWFATEDVTRWAIAERLNARGVPGPGRTRKSKRRQTEGGQPTKWSSEAVGTILSNPLYVGDYRWAEHGIGRYYRLIAGQIKPAPDGGGRVLNDDGGIFRRDAYRDFWQGPFIDRELWEACQKKLATTNRQRCSRRNPFTLSGLLHCGHCGGFMSGAVSETVSTKGKRYAYRKYVCNTPRRYGKTACRNQSIREDRILPFLLSRLETMYLSPERVESLRQKLLEKVTARHEQAPGQVDRLKERLGKADQEILAGRRNLFRVTDDATFVELNKELQEAIERRDRIIRELIQAEREQESIEVDVQAEVDRAMARVDNLAVELRNSPPERLRAILKKLIVRVDLYYEEPEPGKTRQWFRFSKGVVKLRPVLEICGCKKIARFAAGQRMT